MQNQEILDIVHSSAMINIVENSDFHADKNNIIYPKYSNQKRLLGSCRHIIPKMRRYNSKDSAFHVKDDRHPFSCLYINEIAMQR